MPVTGCNVRPEGPFHWKAAFPCRHISFSPNHVPPRAIDINASANNRSAKIEGEIGDARAFEAERLEDWTDQELFTRFLRHRDETVYAILYERHWNRLCECAGRVIKDHSHAEDVAQEIFLVVWKNSERFVATRNPGSLLMKMAHDRAVDFARRENRMELKGLKMDVGNGSMIFESLLPDEKAEFWRKLREHLTPTQFQMIELRYLRGLKVSECAESQEVKTGKVKRHLHEAMKRMKKENLFSTFLASHSDCN